MLDSTATIPRSLSRSLAALPICFALLLPGCGGGVDDRIAEARALQQAGDFSSSIEPLRDALAQDPDHAGANFLLGVALVQTRQPTLAIWPLRKAAETEAHAAAAGLLLANTLLSTGGFEEALAAADAVLERQPGNLGAMMVRAQAHMSTGRHEEALADAEAALTIDAENPQAMGTRAVVLAKLGRLDESEAAFRALEASLAAKGEPELAARGCAVVAGFFVENRVDAPEAEKEVLRCLEADPAREDALGVAVRYYDAKGREGDANALYRAAIEEAPDRLPLRMALADRLANQGESAEAETVLREAAELFDDASAWDRLARFHLEQGELDAARDANESALAAAQGEPAMLLLRKADLLVVAGEYDEAITTVEGLESMYREAIQGRVRLERGDAPGALEALEASLLRWPNNAGVRYLAGQAAEQAGDVEKARSHYREAVRSDPGATDAGLALAKLELEQGNYDEAGNAALKHMKERPFLGPDAHAVAVRAAAASGRDEAARRLLTELAAKPGMELRAAIERAAFESRASGPEEAARVLRESGVDFADPESEVALRLLADYLIAAGRADEALAVARAARERSPDAAQPHEIEGSILGAMGRRDDAVAAFGRALEADAGYARAHVALASMALAAGDTGKALESADAALAADAANSQARYLRAEVLFRTGRADEGMAELRAVAERDPTHVAAANDLAWRLAQRGEDLDLALRLASRAVRLEPQAETLDTLGWVQLRKGDAAGAAESLSLSLGKRVDPSVLYRLGLALDDLGRSEEALRAFERAVEKGTFPEAEEARAQIARLSSVSGAVR